MAPDGGNGLISTNFPFDNKCICAFHSQSISCFDTKLWFCLINKKLSKTTPFVQVFRKKKTLWREKRSKSTFLLYKYCRHVSSVLSVFDTYTMKYSILSIFRAKQKLTLRPWRKYCSLLRVICDERIPFELFLHKVEIWFVSFLIPLFASKIDCFRYLKKGTFKFSWNVGERACARATWKLFRWKV